MAVSDSTLDTSVWDEVKSIIVAAAPYITNSTTSATEAATINAMYNDKTANRPQVTIEPIEVDESLNRFGGTEGRKFINITIMCTYTNGLGADQLTEQVTTALKSNTIAGIELVGLTSGYDFNVAARSKVQSKTTTYTYDRE